LLAKNSKSQKDRKSMQSSMADQLQHLDEQLLQCELLPGEQAAVDEFRVWILQLRQRRHGELGPFPADDMVERSAWQARKEQLDAAMEPEIESERLLRGGRHQSFASVVSINIDATVDEL